MFVGGSGNSSTQASAPNVWGGSNYVSGTTATTNVWATANNYIEFTGLQVEKGTIPTPFEFRPFATELSLCQRYYEKSFPVSVAPVVNYAAEALFLPTAATSTSWYMVGHIPFKVPKRATNGTVALYNPYNSNAATNTTLRIPGMPSTTTDANIYGTPAALYNGVQVAMSNATPYAYYAHYTCDAEL